MRNKPRFYYFFLRLCTVAAISVALAGCASLDTKPYTQYAETVKTAKQAMDDAMNFSYDWTREGFIQTFDGKFSELIIQPGEGYTWAMAKTPLYLSIKRTQETLMTLNQSFVDYATLLENLATLNISDPDQFEQLAKELNENTKQAWAALGKPEADQEITLISLGAMELSRLYLQNRQQEQLRKVIEKNQPAVEKYATQCIELLHIVRAAVKTYYAEHYQPYWKAWRKADKDDRATIVEAMLKLNDKYVDTMRLLAGIEATYAQLPQAHKDLTKPIDAAKVTVDRQGLQKLYDAGKRLQRLYEMLKENN